MRKKRTQTRPRQPRRKQPPKKCACTSAFRRLFYDFILVASGAVFSKMYWPNYTDYVAAPAPTIAEWIAEGAVIWRDIGF